MKLGEIKAQVMYSWNKDRNPGCRFYPGDECIVNIKNNVSFKRYSKLQCYKNGRVGRILAVTTDNDKTLRSTTRLYTHYYVLFDDGEVYGYLPRDLVNVWDCINKMENGIV